MRSWTVVLLIGGLALAGCKGSGDEAGTPEETTPDEAALDAHSGEVSAMIKAGKVDVEACGQAEKAGGEAAVGKISVTFVIEGDGTISKTVVEESSTNSETANACVLAVIQAWTFPPHPAGETIEYTYPFNVQP
jgi:TonB family protein